VGEEDTIISTRWVRVYWNSDALALGLALHPLSGTFGIYIGPITICIGFAQDD
jgi:hypothetical protein